LGLELAERLSVDIDILVNRKRKADGRPGTCNLREMSKNYSLNKKNNAKQQACSSQNKLEQAVVQRQNL